MCKPICWQFRTAIAGTLGGVKKMWRMNVFHSLPHSQKITCLSKRHLFYFLWKTDGDNQLHCKWVIFCCHVKLRDSISSLVKFDVSSASMCSLKCGSQWSWATRTTRYVWGSPTCPSSPRSKVLRPFRSELKQERLQRNGTRHRSSNDSMPENHPFTWCFQAESSIDRQLIG